ADKEAIIKELLAAASAFGNAAPPTPECDQQAYVEGAFAVQDTMGPFGTRLLEVSDNAAIAAAYAAARSPGPASSATGDCHAHDAARLTAKKTEEAMQAQLLRDVFGNPFRPVRSELRWLSAPETTVSLLAQAIYRERAFDRLPVLADALEEAGC